MAHAQKVARLLQKTAAMSNLKSETKNQRAIMDDRFEQAKSIVATCADEFLLILDVFAAIIIFKPVDEHTSCFLLALNTIAASTHSRPKAASSKSSTP